MNKTKKIGEFTKDITMDMTLGDLISLLRFNHGAHLELADEILGQVSWHDNMPKSSKLKFIEMMEYHIKSFNSNLDINDDTKE